MDSIVTALQGAFTGPNALGNLLKTGVTAAGGIGDIIAQQKQNSALNTALGYQKNPAKAAQVINSLTQPLSAGLTSSVGNDVQGYLAERGLSGSPNITAMTLAQALAPYQQQEQQLATQQFGALINPLGAGFKGPIDWGSLMKLWMPTPSIGGQTPNQPQTSNPINQIGPMPSPTFPNLTPGWTGATPPTIPSTIYSPDVGDAMDNYSVND